VILHLLIRLVFILLGYALATVASALVVTAAFCASDPPRPDDVPGIFALITMLIGIYAALPATVAVAIGEIRPIRSRLYYMVVGSFIGTGLPIYVQIETWFIAIGLLFGFVAGLIYWGVAGRKAGVRRT
jgi:hypothetical protein